MGIQLIREVYDHAPADLTPAEMNLLVAVAWTARDSTREAHLRDGQEQLMLLARMTRRQVKDAYTALDSRGIQLRVPMRHADGAVRYRKDGTPLYAARGHVTVLRIPRLAAGAPVDNRPVDNPGKGPPEVPLSPEKGVRIEPERGPDPTRKGSLEVPPRKSSGSHRKSDLRAREPDDLVAVIRAVEEATGKTIDGDHAAKVLRQLVNGRGDVQRPGRYAAAAIRNDANPTRFLPTPIPPRNAHR